PLLFLRVRAVEVDGAAGETAVDAKEGREGSISSRDFHGHQSDQQRTPTGAAVAVDAGTGDAQLLERREQLERKRVLDPVLVDDWLDLRLHVFAYFLDDRHFLGGQIRGEFIEVDVGGRQRLGVVYFLTVAISVLLQSLTHNLDCRLAINLGHGIRRGPSLRLLRSGCAKSA